MFSLYNILMGRAPQIDLGGYVYHVINRANGRVQIFNTNTDYQDFEYLLNEIRETYGMRILGYVIMPNHWHLLLYPREDGDLSKSLQWLGTAHARRHHTRNETIGNGHLYQGRYKSFLVESDSHLLSVLKYIERNPVRAKLCKRAEDWQWGSARRRKQGGEFVRLLSELPTELSGDYWRWIHTPDSITELEEIRNSVNRGVAYGEVLL